MDKTWQDVRSGWRMLIEHPALSIIAILIFGLGIGMTTTVFSVVNGALFKGLPFPEADRIVALVSANPARNFPRTPVNAHDFAVWKERQTVYESLGPHSAMPVNLSRSGGQPERFTAGLPSSGVVDKSRVKPLLGRTFRAAEDQPGTETVILLGYDIWRDRFGGSADIIGKTVRANGVTRTIVGVMPERFAFPEREQLWMPLDIDPLATKRGDGPSYPVLARLTSGVSIKEARAQAAAIAAQIEKEYPETNRGSGADDMS